MKRYHNLVLKWDFIENQCQISDMARILEDYGKDGYELLSLHPMPSNSPRYPNFIIALRKQL
jgi:hypothetical protein